MVCEDECGWKAFYEKPDMSPTADIQPILNVHDTIKLNDRHKVYWGDLIWMKMDGHKSIIGLVVAGGGLVAKLCGLGLVGETLMAGGLAFGNFIGLGHKGAKKLNKITSGDKINWNEIFKLIVDLIKKLIFKGGN